jgi:NitT/TauT family transport system substrate-binding protein
MIGKRMAALVSGLVMVAALAGCGDDESSGEGDGGNSVSIKYSVIGEPGADALPGIMAVKRLEEKYGYKVEIVEVAELPIALEGLSSDEFQLGSGAASATFNAVLSGADVKMVGVETGMVWVMQGIPGLETCADLAGKTIGLHAAGSAGEGYFKYWTLENCTPAEAEKLKIVYVPGSDARAQALLAGELDATMITYTEIPLVEASTETMFEFKDVGDLSKLSAASGLLAGGPFMEDHPEIVTQFLEEVVTGQEEMQTLDGLREAVAYALPNLEGEDAESAAQLTFDSGTVLTEGGRSVLENMSNIVDFMVNTTGELPEEAMDHTEDFYDASFLKEALTNVG